jgi:hypothetical protein
MSGGFVSSRSFLVAAVVVWLGLVVAGAAALVHYGAGPGESGQAPQLWPAQTTLPRSASQHLLVFVHPHCPCTRATLEQLHRALAHAQRGLTVRAVVFAPTREPADWTDTALVRHMKQIPGAQVTLDENGREAARFAVRTSGHVLLYSAAGRLQFSGGVTPGRGHQGSATGLTALVTQLGGQGSGPDRAPVFGCPIFAPPSHTQEGDGECQCP